MAKNEKKKTTEEYVPTCFWKRTWIESLHVGCRNMRVLAAQQRDADYNFEQKFVFCPYCGRKLEITSI